MDTLTIGADENARSPVYQVSVSTSKYFACSTNAGFGAGPDITTLQLKVRCWAVRPDTGVVGARCANLLCCGPGNGRSRFIA